MTNEKIKRIHKSKLKLKHGTCSFTLKNDKNLFFSSHSFFFVISCVTTSDLDDECINTHESPSFSSVNDDKYSKNQY